MKLSIRGKSDLKTCFILGAGATRAARFRPSPVAPAVPISTGPLPPLDTDFFKQIQFLRNKIHIEVAEELLRYVVSEYGTGFNLTMEQFFAQVEVLPKLLKELSIMKGVKSKAPERARTLFHQSLAAIFDETLLIHTSDSYSHKICEDHQ